MIQAVLVTAPEGGEAGPATEAFSPVALIFVQVTLGSFALRHFPKGTHTGLGDESVRVLARSRIHPRQLRGQGVTKGLLPVVWQGEGDEPGRERLPGTSTAVRWPFS